MSCGFVEQVGAQVMARNFSTSGLFDLANTLSRDA